MINLWKDVGAFSDDPLLTFKMKFNILSGFLFLTNIKCFLEMGIPRTIHSSGQMCI